MLWFDGALHETSVVPFDLTDRGLLLGDGVFDTSMVLGGKMVWRKAHVARLALACQALGFSLDEARLGAGIDAILARMDVGSLRITVTRGAGPRGIAPPKKSSPSLLVAGAAPRPENYFAPVSLAVTPIRRNETSPFCQTKTLNYLDAIEANRAAHMSGFDDALFLNTQGHVACTCVGNVLAFFGEQVVTPPDTDGTVGGITRAIVLENCAELGLETIERSMTLAELESADAAVVTNSLRLVAPVTALGRKHLGSSERRRVQSLIDLVARLVQVEAGIDPRTLSKS